ncbi:MAG: xanthine dehydrogenase family protein subunit M [Salinirussus sp.]
MKPAPFEYHRPSTVAETTELLADLPDAELMAGNQSFGIIMSNRLAQPDHIVDINGVDALDYIEVGEDVVEVGAMTSHADIEHSTELAETVPMLPQAAGVIAGPAVRNRGTIGGSVGEADPAGNHGCALLALGAELEIASADGSRTVDVDDYFLAYMFTDLSDEELITAARIPREPFPVDRTGMDFRVRKRAAQTWPTIGVGTAVRVDDPAADVPRIEDVRIALANAADVPLRTADAEAELEGEPLTEAGLVAAGEIVSDAVEPEDEMHADETYKRELAAEYTERSVRAAHDGALE